MNEYFYSFSIINTNMLNTATTTNTILLQQRNLLKYLLQLGNFLFIGVRIQILFEEKY